MPLFAAEAVEIRLGQAAALAQDIAVGIVEVASEDDAVRGDEAGDVAVAVAVVEGVEGRGWRLENRGWDLGTGEETADPAGTFERAAQVATAGVGDELLRNGG